MLTPVVVAIAALPLIIPAGAGIAIGAKSARRRAIGLVCALAATATVAFAAGQAIPDIGNALCGRGSAAAHAGLPRPARGFCAGRR